MSLFALSALPLLIGSHAVAQISTTGKRSHAGARGGAPTTGAGRPREAGPAPFEGRDDRTGGNWPGAYGKQAFLVPVPAGIAHFTAAGFRLERGSCIPQGKGANAMLSSLPSEQRGEERLDANVKPNAPLTSTRVPLGGNGLTTRNNVSLAAHQSAFPDPKTGKLQVVGFPMVLRADTTDGRPHRLSIYCLDYLRTGCALKIELYDLRGRLLVTQRIDHYGDGTYARFRIKGSVIAVISTLTKADPKISGVFIDPD